MALLSQILKNFQDSRDSLGNLLQDHTTLPVEKLFLISNLNLPNCSLKPLALVITLGTTKRSIFIYQCQYNLPAAFFFFNAIYGSLHHREKIAFLLGKVMFQECHEVKSVVSTCGPKISDTFWMSSRHLKNKEIIII